MALDNDEISRAAIQDVEIDILEFAEREEQVPHARAYRVRIDGETVKVHTPCPTGENLLSKVGKRACAFELIADFRHHENCVIEPHETVDLRRHGLKGFITAHKEIVTIFINDKPYPIERGDRTVAEILSKLGQTPEGYTLLEEKNGPPMPVPPHQPVKICGCEIFHSQAQSGGSS
jgi:sulfur carrier protein ThiS